MRFLFLFTLHQLVESYREFTNSTSKVIMLRCNRYSGYNNIYLIQVFVKKCKFLAYHLEDLRVPLVVRVPQVGNLWSTWTRYTDTAKSTVVSLLEAAICYCLHHVKTVSNKRLFGFHLRVTKLNENQHLKDRSIMSPKKSKPVHAASKRHCSR